jgi:hypothetical protein
MLSEQGKKSKAKLLLHRIILAVDVGHLSGLGAGKADGRQG